MQQNYNTKIAVVTGILGLVTLVTALFLMPVFPQEAAISPVPYSKPVYAFEMARTVDDLQAVFGLPDDPERQVRIAAMDMGNKWDFAFMALYGAFIALFFYGAYQQRGRTEVVWKYFVYIAILSAIADAVETSFLLHITNNLEAGEGLSYLPYAVLTKFTALGLCGVGVGLFILKEKNALWKASGVLAAVAGLVTLWAFYFGDNYGLFHLTGDAIGLAWIIQLIYAFKVARSKN